MSFDYDKNKNSHGNDSFWTSYSDLFLGLSAIFLLLYVTSSLRTGTDALRGQVENQKLTMKVEELQSQLKMYESVKTNYMQSEAAKDEVQEYQELMDKLTLLEEDAKDEKTRLAQASLENERKAKALNKYQQMVRNVLNANKVAKSRIISRGEVIGEQIEEIGQQKVEISTLEKDVSQKKRKLEENDRKIAEAEKALEKNIAALKHSYKENKLTKKAFDKKLKMLKEQSDSQVSALQEANEKYEGQIKESSLKINQLGQTLVTTQSDLENTKSALGTTQSDLKNAKSTLNETQGALKAAEATASGFKSALDATTKDAESLRGEIDSLQASHRAEKAKERAAFDAKMKKMKLGAAERAAQEGAFRAAAERKEKDLQSKLSGLAGQLKDTEGALAKAKEEIDARRAVAQEIQKGFSKVGVKADIDMQTGEVVLDFGDAYFESDSANIKAEMKKVLEKAMPIYSQSLFGNPKVAEKISAVEIIGFASPTYQGRYIDPKSKSVADKAAIKYNMDLSYRRAKAIFGHVLDQRGDEFSHQQELMALMKVSGRSFLEVMNVKNRDVANAAEFCRQNDCKKAQRVIVRFSMDKKK